MALRMKSTLKSTMKEVREAENAVIRQKPLPELQYETAPEGTEVPSKEKAKEYVEVTLAGSNGQAYTCVMPRHYAKYVPKVWEWTEERYKVAEMIAQGIPYAEIARDPNVNVKARITIYAWLQHPEFRKHVDGLILETGWANKRERIAGLTRVTEKLFKRIVNDIDKVKLNEKSVGSFLVGLQTIAKQLAQEKEEFVEHAKVEQNTKLSGVVGVLGGNLDNYLKGASEDERKALEAEFDKVGDDIVRGITGEKE